MLERSRLLAELPNLVHGFTNRHGGVSRGRFASLNLGRKWGDEPAAVDENLLRVAQAGDFGLEHLRRVQQVHGCTVVEANPKPTSAGEDLEPADGIWCRAEHGLTVAVTTADCVPVLLADAQAGVAAAVHSGWRGTVAQIVPIAIEALIRAGAQRSNLIAAIGPCIELAAFEVGHEVAAAFDDRFVATGFAKPHVDLVAAIAAQLKAAGVRPEMTERVGCCTHAHSETYFSYRRDGAGTGQMMSFVGFCRN